VPPRCRSEGHFNPMGGVVGLYGKLTTACILICHTCSRGPSVRRVRLSLASLVGVSDTRKAEPGDLCWSRGTDPVPERLLGRGHEPGSPRPSGRSGSRAQAVWKESQATRTVIHSRRGLGLARMPVENGPTGDPGFVDPSPPITASQQSLSHVKSLYLIIHNNNKRCITLSLNIKPVDAWTS
jgi:hypothetical protein